MKYGVITDVHGNILALNAVLEELEKRKVDRIICCGDIVGIGPRSEEAVQKLKQIRDKLIAVRGNHEQYILKAIPEKIHGRDISEDEIGFHKWTRSHVSNDAKAFLESLPFEQIIEDDGKKIYVAHYAYGENDKFKDFIMSPNIQESEELFSEVDADVYLFGHTHVKTFNKSKGKWYINPGSLGCPKDTNIACCGVLNIDANNIDFEELQVEYDKEAVVQELLNIKYPYYQVILDIFFGNKPVQ